MDVVPAEQRSDSIVAGRVPAANRMEDVVGQVVSLIKRKDAVNRKACDCAGECSAGCGRVVDEATDQQDPSDAGMSTVEYAVGTVVAAAFAAVLYQIVTGDSVISGLTDLINRALSTSF